MRAILALLLLTLAACDSVQSPEREPLPDPGAHRGLILSRQPTGQPFFRPAATLGKNASFQESLNLAQTGCYISTPDLNSGAQGRYRYDAMAVRFPDSLVAAAGGQNDLVELRFGSTTAFAASPRAVPVVVRVARCVIPKAEGAREMLRDALRNVGASESERGWEGEPMVVPDSTLRRWGVGSMAALGSSARREAMGKSTVRQSMQGVSSCVESLEKERIFLYSIEMPNANGGMTRRSYWLERWVLYTCSHGTMVVFENTSEESDGGGTGSDPVCSREAQPWDAIDAFECPIEEPLPVIGPTESKEGIQDWYRDKCAITDEKKIDRGYERSLADFLLGGLGTGRVERFLTPEGTTNRDGFDGYQTWFFDRNGNRLTNYVSLVMEAKLSNNPFFDSRSSTNEALQQLEFLASERNRYMNDHPGLAYYGNPIWLYVSQNQRADNPTHPDEDRREPGWWIGTRGEYGDWHQTILDRANQLGITVVHMKLANQELIGGGEYRNLTFRLLSDYPVLQTPVTEWLRKLTSVVPKNVTIETLMPFRFDCGAPNQPPDKTPPGVPAPR